MSKVLTESEAYVISVLRDYAINKNIDASRTIDLKKVDVIKFAEQYQIPNDQCAILLSELKHKGFIFNHHLQLSTNDNPIFIKTKSGIINYKDIEHFTLKPLENALISQYSFEDNVSIEPTILNKEYGIASVYDGLNIEVNDNGNIIKEGERISYITLCPIPISASTVYKKAEDIGSNIVLTYNMFSEQASLKDMSCNKNKEISATDIYIEQRYGSGLPPENLLESLYNDTIKVSFKDGRKIRGSIEYSNLALKEMLSEGEDISSILKDIEIGVEEKIKHSLPRIRTPFKIMQF